MITLAIWSLLFAAEHKKIAESGKAQVQLVELYSSESCSSCPPADNWISALKDKPGLWSKFVPVVFHVDYWNHLGWKDGLSSNAMTTRQREVASQWPEPSVYTPAVVVNGREHRGWSAGLPDAAGESNITLTIYKEGANEFEVVVEGLPPKAAYTLRVAKLGMGMSTDVAAGENSGRKLMHNFVILDWNSRDAVNGGNSFKLSGKSAPRTAVAAWIELKGKSMPLQAAGGYL